MLVWGLCTHTPEHRSSPRGCSSWGWRGRGNGASVEAVLRSGDQLHPIPRAGPYLGHPSPSASERGQGWMVVPETSLGKRHQAVEQGKVQGKVLEL